MSTNGLIVILLAVIVFLTIIMCAVVKWWIDDKIDDKFQARDIRLDDHDDRIVMLEDVYAEANDLRIAANEQRGEILNLLKLRNTGVV